jgi:hypothetical protein
LKEAFAQRLKPLFFCGSYGTAEAVPFQSRFKVSHCHHIRPTLASAACMCVLEFATSQLLTGRLRKNLRRGDRLPQALKRGYILGYLSARLNVVPFPSPLESEFFRSLLESRF